MGAVIVTTLIALIWVTTLPARFSTLSGAGSSVRDDVSEKIEEAPLAQDAFSVPETAPAYPVEEEMTEEEKLRSRIDAMVSDLSRTRAEREEGAEKQVGVRSAEGASTTTVHTVEPAASTIGAPVIIETR